MELTDYALINTERSSIRADEDSAEGCPSIELILAPGSYMVELGSSTHGVVTINLKSR